MFLRDRSMQVEYFDARGRDEAEMARAFEDLDRLNRLFQFSRPFREVLQARKS